MRVQAMTVDFDLEGFSPAEAERITGLSVAMQRNYRVRGTLRHHDGHARHTVFDLALMMVAKGLNARGLEAGLSNIAPIVATEVARRALEHEDAYAGHSDLARADPVELAADVLHQYSPIGPGNASLRMPRLFVIHADLTGSFYDAVDADMLERQAPASIVGPLVILDTLALGAHILAAAGRPLARVSEAIPFEAFSRPARVLAS